MGTTTMLEKHRMMRPTISLALQAVSTAKFASFPLVYSSLLCSAMVMSVNVVISQKRERELIIAYR